MSETYVECLVARKPSVILSFFENTADHADGGISHGGRGVPSRSGGGDHYRRWCVLCHDECKHRV